MRRAPSVSRRMSVSATAEQAPAEPLFVASMTLLAQDSSRLPAPAVRGDNGNPHSQDNTVHFLRRRIPVWPGIGPVFRGIRLAPQLLLSWLLEVTPRGGS